MEEIPPDDGPVKLDYRSSPPAIETAGKRSWMFRVLSRFSRPMPLGMYMLIMWSLSLLALAAILVIKLIVDALH